MIDAAADEVHRFWFGECIDDPAATAKRNTFWFGSSSALDEEIRERFGATIEAAARGELTAWEAAPRSCVSLVIMLDQFPRNAYRNSARAFEFDPISLATARRAVSAGYLGSLSVPERAFLLMPYQHVEDLVLQREGVTLFEQLSAQAPPEWRAFADSTLDFARRHLQIVERFGRFPHRNRVLARNPTKAEEEYLAAEPETFGQGGS